MTTSAPNGHVVRTPTLRAPSKDVNNGVAAATPAPLTTSTSSSQNSLLSTRTESCQKLSVSTSSSSSLRTAPSVVQEPKAKRPPPKLVIPPPETTESNVSVPCVCIVGNSCRLSGCWHEVCSAEVAFLRSRRGFDNDGYASDAAPRSMLSGCHIV